MKTAEEILFSITKREDVSIDECLTAMKLYAEQFIDEAANEAETSDFFGLTIINKESILSLKDQLK